MITGWKMSKTMLKNRIIGYCQHCSEWMGNDHNYEDCYLNDRTIYTRCDCKSFNRFKNSFPREEDYENENYLKNRLDKLGVII